jgi:hypothetical protein
MDEIVYSCSRCKRPIRAPRAQALVLLRKKRTRCQVCGSALEFPKDVLDEFEGAHKVGAKDVREDVSFKCEGCKRTYKRPLGDLVVAIVKNKTTCTLCAKPYVFPPEVHEAVAKLKAQGAIARELEIECPVCLRGVRGDGRAPDTVMTCGYCGARLRAGPDGEGCRAPPLEGAAASPDAVKRALARMPRDEAAVAAGQALLARASRGETAEGEPEAVVERLARLAEWHPEEYSSPFVPLSVADAEAAVPAILFTGLVGHRDRSSGTLELVFTIGRQTAMTGQGLINVVSLATVLAGGGGVFLLGGDGSTRDALQRLRLSFNETPRGVELGIAHQVDDGRPKRGGAKEHAALRDRLVAMAPAFRNYFALGAIYGACARGSTLVAASVPAIERRLTALGEPLAARAAALAPRLKVSVEAPRS